MLRIRHPRDFWSGTLFVLLGGAAVLWSRAYPLGTTFKMGPGYFPTALGALLVMVGLLAILRSTARDGAALEPIHGRLLLIVLGSVILFGVLVRGAGLVAAIPVLVMTASLASRALGWKPALALALGMSMFCVVVFIKLLGLPIALIGPWLGG